MNREWWPRLGQCAICVGVTTGTLCAACEADLRSDFARCDHCAEPLAMDGICKRCQQRKSNSLQHVVAALLYDEPARFLVHRLKFYGDVDVASLFAEIAVAALPVQAAKRPEVLIPVPIHPRRLRQRGFNQAAVLADQISKRTAIPVRHGVLRKMVDSPAQSTLDRQDRHRLSAKQFSCDVRLTGQRVAIVDDVMTTGTTLRAIATVLKAAGAESIQAMVACRAARSSVQVGHR